MKLSRHQQSLLSFTDFVTLGECLEAMLQNPKPFGGNHLLSERKTLFSVNQTKEQCWMHHALEVIFKVIKLRRNRKKMYIDSVWGESMYMIFEQI